MKELIILCMAISYSISALCQENMSKITGKVMDKQSEPLGFANVLLMKASDTSLIKGALTDESGKFEMDNINRGNYLLEITMLGFDKQFVPITIKTNSPVVNFKTIILVTNTNLLKGVTIVSTPPFIEQEADKLIINIANHIVSTGGTALDVLSKAPEIMVNPVNSTISMKGNSGVLIQINGRETHLSGSDLTNSLKGVPADEIEKIEIINNPPAKYDAEGTAGIINIITKKNTDLGTNGTIRLGGGYGRFGKYNGGFTINHRSGKVNMYGSYNFSHNRTFSTEDLQTTYLPKGEITAIHHNYSLENSYSTYQSFNAGGDWYISNNTTAGISVNGLFNVDKYFPSTAHTSIFDSKNIMDSTLLSESHGNDWDNLISGNIYFNYTFDSTGRKFSVEGDYSNYQSNGYGFYSNTYLDNTSQQTGVPYILNERAPISIDIKAAQADYVQPLRKNITLDIGIKTSEVTTANQAQFDVFQNQAWINDTTRSNTFQYKENINAAYASLKVVLKKTTMEAGLRVEQTISDGISVTMDSTVKRNYTKLFPSIFIEHDFNDNNQLSLSYSKRITRPDYQNLNPFISFIDLYSYDEGNPFLQPVMSNSFGLNYTFKGNYILSMGYEEDNGTINNIPYLIDPVKNITRIMPENLDYVEDFDLRLSANFNITHWWTVNANAETDYIKYSNDFPYGTLDNNGVTGMFNITTDFTLPDKFKFELSGNYLSKFPAGTFTQQPFYNIDAGISKSFFKDKLDMKAGFNDIFNTNHPRYTSDFGGIQESERYRYETQKGFLTFTYHFGSDKLKTKKHENTAAKEELNRIK